MRVIDEPSPVPQFTAQRRRGDRAPMLFVAVPLTAALVFAAAPLSKPPPRPSPSASPALTTASESRAARSGAQAAMLAPPLVPATCVGGNCDVTLGRSRSTLTARAMVVVAKGVERIDIQAP